MNDVYRTIERPGEFRQKIERSEFLAFAFHVSSEAEFMTALESVKKQHFDATHHCWAFRLFAEERARSSDAGEPSGSAGKPILSAIESPDLHDAGVIVVRWFGGVKLGTGGLARAYRSTAAAAIERSTVIDRYVYARVRVIVPFDRVSDAYRFVDPPNIVLAGEEYGETNIFAYDVRASWEADFRKGLTERRLTLP